MSLTLTRTRRRRTPPPLRRPAAVRLAWLAVALLVAAVLLCVRVGRASARGVVGFDDDRRPRSSGDVDGIAAGRRRRRAIPRTVLALLVGAALAMSGATMQAVTRNPLADPGILGVSGGAALAVVIGIAFFALADPYAIMAVAIAGRGGGRRLRLRRRLARPRRRDPAQARAGRRGDRGGVHARW